MTVKYLIPATLVLVTLVNIASTGIIDDIKDGIDAITCPARYTKQYDTCTAIANPFYSWQAQMEQDSAKTDCCTYLARRDCTAAVAAIMCGENTGEAMAEVMSAFKGLISSRCSAYQTITDCTHPAVLIISVVLIAVVVSAILRCVCDCLCGGGRRYRR